LEEVLRPCERADKVEVAYRHLRMIEELIVLRALACSQRPCRPARKKAADEF
jgi:hypothetical protein